MEIISYTDTNSYPIQKSSRIQLKHLFRDRERSVSAVAVKPSYALSLGNVRASFVEGVYSVKKYVHYVWVVPAVVICALVPFTVSKLMSYAESFAGKVSFDTSDSALVEILDSALAEFALYGKGSFDTDGTVLSAEGTAVQSVSVSFKQPVTYQTYKVRAGDTIDTISRKFDLSNISTLIAVNNIDNVRSLRSGQKLSIPSMDGLVHTVGKGETLNGLSVKFNVTVEDLLDVNDLASEMLSVGMNLFIPGARLDISSLHKAMGEMFAWPITAVWHLSSHFGPRPDPKTGVESYHTGIDMACPMGTPIKAAMAGKVAYTGVSNVFGNYVILTHADGYQTLYGHMSKIIAKKGETVSQGTKIGLVGSTGYSTGPHLHFTVYKNGRLVDPLTLLK